MVSYSMGCEGSEQRDPSPPHSYHNNLQFPPSIAPQNGLSVRLLGKKTRDRFNTPAGLELDL